VRVKPYREVPSKGMDMTCAWVRTAFTKIAGVQAPRRRDGIFLLEWNLASPDATYGNFYFPDGHPCIRSVAPLPLSLTMPLLTRRPKREPGSRHLQVPSAPGPWAA
jgi:hypothetical protein